MNCLQLTGTSSSPDNCSLEKNSQKTKTKWMYLFSHKSESRKGHAPPHPGWEETNTIMEQASHRQHCGAGGGGLGAPHLRPQCFLSTDSPLPCPSAASGVPSPQTCDVTGVQGPETQITGWGNRLWGAGAGVGDGCSGQPDCLDVRPCGPLPFPKHV